MSKDDLDMAILAIGHYRRLWKVLEDLETLLWKIKELNDDMEEPSIAEE
jgi:hypothetical protein